MEENIKAKTCFICISTISENMAIIVHKSNKKINKVICTICMIYFDYLYIKYYC